MVALKKKRPSLQIQYDTDADYEETKSNIDTVSFAEWEESQEYPGGRCWIHIKNKNYSNIVFFKKGLIQITYHSIKELQEIQDFLPAIFVTINGRTAETFNERSIVSQLELQIEKIDLEIKILQSDKETLKIPTPYGYVAVKDKNGNLVHPIAMEIDNQIQQLYKKKFELFPWCEGPIENDEICDTCSRSIDPRYLTTNFDLKPGKFCPVYDVI